MSPGRLFPIFFEAFSILARDRVDRMLYDPNQDLRITWFRGLPP
jgi:hypothetical protein